MNDLGLDWASRAHDVAVLDEAGGVLDRWAFPHSERTSSLVVDRLLAAGHPVVSVHPTAYYAARPRWGASGARSDPGDSDKLADYLRTDGHRLRRLAPTDPGLHELQALVRLNLHRPDLGQHRLRPLSATLEYEAYPTLENESTRSSLLSLRALGLMQGRVSMG